MSSARLYAFPIQMSMAAMAETNGRSTVNGGAAVGVNGEMKTASNNGIVRTPDNLPAAHSVENVPQKLVGYQNFVRHNPKSDHFNVQRFHHLEFYCGDALNVSHRFAWGLGMHEVARSNLSTGNHIYSSHVLQSNEITFVFTAPYSRKLSAEAVNSTTTPHPGFDPEAARSFFDTHGLAVAAVGLLVADATSAYEESIKHGAVGVRKPVRLIDAKARGALDMSEVALYGDVVLRYVSIPASAVASQAEEEREASERPPPPFSSSELKPFAGPFLPNYEPVEGPALTLGLTRVDHVVGNVPRLLETVQYVAGLTGFHEFAEFVAEDVGTVDSGLNSMVLANNDEQVLLPINEPTFGTPRKSQIQTYLEHNEGPGVQHLALSCKDILHTVRGMRGRSCNGGFEFMPRATETYYRNLQKKVGDSLTEDQLRQCEELGILVDKDDEGVLMQIFTKPLGDRPTIFIEIIQRIGCMEKDKKGNLAQRGGCGGFGKGNFSELFKSIEEFEKTFD